MSLYCHIFMVMALWFLSLEILLAPRAVSSVEEARLCLPDSHPASLLFIHPASPKVNGFCILPESSSHATHFSQG
ncbi:hypothetical protein ACRRTK_003609 [Alexandromys fortis]